MANNNPNYTVIIKQTADPSQKGIKGIEIVAPMPDSFMFDTKSEYATPYAQGLFGGGSGMLAQIGKVAGQLGGMRMTSQALTAQLWQGSTETSLNLELEFHAETDPDLDVRQPILALMRMSTASINATSGLLTSPGPSITLDSAGAVVAGLFNSAKDTVTGAPAKIGELTSGGMISQNNGVSSAVTSLKETIKNQISIQIGRYAFFDSVVISNVQKTYSHQIDHQTGLPMHAKVSFTFTPLFLVVQSDLTNIFGSH